MDARLRFWLNGLLAGLFALAILPVPGQHARATVERIAFIAAYAMPDGTLPEICSGHGHPQDRPADGHGQHPPIPDCLACVLMAAPGLAASPFLLPTPAVAPVDAGSGEIDAGPARGFAWPPHRARAPPAGFIA